jgi:hypothetical protein
MSTNRPTPLMGVGSYKTYSLVAPRATHHRRVSCEVYGCEPFLKGFATTALPDSEEEATIRQACAGEIDGIRRPLPAFTVTPDGFHRYAFPPGTPCFRAVAHTVHNDRPPIPIVRPGDHRGDPTGGDGRRIHASTDDWVEDFAEHQDRLATAAKEG